MERLGQVLAQLWVEDVEREHVLEDLQEGVLGVVLQMPNEIHQLAGRVGIRQLALRDTSTPRQNNEPRKPQRTERP